MTKRQNNDPYGVLRIRSSATVEDIDAAAQKLLKRYYAAAHEDDALPDNKERYEQVEQAQAKLSTPAGRRHYVQTALRAEYRLRQQLRAAATRSLIVLAALALFFPLRELIVFYHRHTMTAFLFVVSLGLLTDLGLGVLGFKKAMPKWSVYFAARRQRCT